MDSNSVVLVGGGGHCKSVIDSLYSMGYGSKDLLVLDHNLKINSEILGVKVVGTDEDLRNLYLLGIRKAFITVGSVGNTKARERIVDVFTPIGFDFVNVIDKSSNVASDVEIGKGSIVNSSTIIGDYCIVNSNTTIEHDCKIGDFSHVSPGAVLNGNVEIGCRVHIGSNSSIREGVTITDDVIIGMGSIVLSNISKPGTYYGVVKENTK